MAPRQGCWAEIRHSEVCKNTGLIQIMNTGIRVDSLECQYYDEILFWGPEPCIFRDFLFIRALN